MKLYKILLLLTWILIHWETEFRYDKVSVYSSTSPMIAIPFIIDTKVKMNIIKDFQNFNKEQCIQLAETLQKINKYDFFQCIGL